jgi:ADP-heptose:LPS heptosyltransferase
MSGAVVAIRPRALGDVVLTTPALASLAAGHPGAELHVVTEARFAPLLAGLPFVTRVWPLPRTTLGTLATANALRRLRPEAAVDFFGNSRTALVARLSGARRTWGYDLRGRRALYDAVVPRETRGPGGRREPAAAVHLRLARAAGGSDASLTPNVSVSDTARARAAGLLATAGVTAPGRTVGLVPAGSWPAKQWPLSHTARLASALEAAGHGVLALTGPGEERLAARLVALAPGVRVLPACDAETLAGVIARLRAVVGTDSGPRHLAAAFGVPTFAWFGPTHPDTWNPPGDRHGYWRTPLPCGGCDLTHCAHWNCLPGLDPETAASLVLSHLARHAGEGGDAR